MEGKLWRTDWLTDVAWWKLTFFWAAAYREYKSKWSSNWEIHELHFALPNTPTTLRSFLAITPKMMKSMTGSPWCDVATALHSTPFRQPEKHTLRYRYSRADTDKFKYSKATCAHRSHCHMVWILGRTFGVASCTRIFFGGGKASNFPWVVATRNPAHAHSGHFTVGKWVVGMWTGCRSNGGNETGFGFRPHAMVDKSWISNPLN